MGNMLELKCKSIVSYIAPVYDVYMNRKTPRIAPALSVYLGSQEVAARRLEALDKLAAQLGMSRSKMIQLLADGKLTLTVARPD